LEAGKARLAIGRARFASELTLESARLDFAVLHLGDHSLSGGVREYKDDESYQALANDLKLAFTSADFPQVIRIIDRHFGSATYSLKSLFRDEQRKIVDQIMKATLPEAEAAFSQIYEQNAPLMRFLANLGTPLPKLLAAAAAFALNGELRRAFGAEELDLARIRGLLEEADAGHVPLDATTLEYTLRTALEHQARQLAADPASMPLLQKLAQAVALARSLPFEVNLWTVQNHCYEILQKHYLGITDPEWRSHFTALCENLLVRVA